MKRTCYKNVHYIGLTDKELETRVKDVPFEWGDKDYPVGEVFDKLGDNPRTSLDLGYPFWYAGRCGNFALFDYKKKFNPQLELFEVEEKHHWFIAPMIMSRTDLFMQSSDSGFWDIQLH